MPAAREGPLRRWLVPAVFDGVGQTQRARMLNRVLLTVIVATTIVMPAIMVAQPDIARRAFVALAVVDTFCLTLLLLARRGLVTLASLLLVGGLIAWTTVLSLSAGGVRSPGVIMHFAFVLMAAVLLGEGAALPTALVCAVIGAVLVAAELNGAIPTRTLYGPIPLYLLNLLYMALVIALTRMATGSVNRALQRAESELADRRVAEERLDRAVTDLGERVKELSLLRNAARLLRESSYFDPAVLRELVLLIPAAMQFPEHAQARATYHGETYATPGWRDGPHRLTQEFESTAGTGRIDVVYTADAPTTEADAFLPEEHELLASLAEMLVRYLDSEEIERGRRALETQLRQAQKMEALGTLAGGIAHDFNNILTAIGGNVDLLLSETENESVRETLREVMQAHERARDLVRRILLFSRQQEPVRTVMHIEPVVEEAIKLIRASVPTSIRIEASFEPDLPPVSADATQIHQIVMNLGTNGAYAMRTRGGVLSVTLDRVVTRDPLEEQLPAELTPGDYVRLTVRDTGEGMSAEVNDRLFEPFFTTKGPGGTGLGLSVVHGIVLDHGGGIDVESEPGRGTVFRVYFPAAATSASPPEPARRPGHGRGERVAYIDDEDAVVFVMTRTLERLGYRAVGFSDPVAAVETIRAAPHEFDAVITDMGMPGLSGTDVAAALRDVRPDLPIAVVSGYGRPSGATDGVSIWIQKPPTREELGEALRGMLG